MIFWSKRFQTIHPSEAFPRPVLAAYEEQSSPEYRNEGRLRQGKDNYMFKYTLYGKGCFRNAEREWPVGPGRGFLCRISDPDIAYYYPPDASQRWEFIWLSFNGGAASLIVEDLIKSYGPIFEPSLDNPGLVWLANLYRSKDSEFFLNVSRAAELICNFLFALRRVKEVAEGHSPDLVSTTLRHINANLAGDLSVAQLAQVAGMSREHFSRRFTLESGQTPHDYVNSRRILAASKLLKETDLSSKAIAVTVGFFDPVLFNRNFKKRLGITPGEFRASNAFPNHVD